MPHTCTTLDSSRSSCTLQRLHRWLAGALLAAASAGCGEGSGTVTIKGDIDGLDTLALRGDSLIAAAERAPQTIDSLRQAAKAELEKARLAAELKSSALGGKAGSAGAAINTAAVDSAVARVAMSPGNEMSRRAQARGDSMARAFAARVSGANTGSRTRGDTVRGVLVRQGVEPARTVMLQVGETLVSLSGMATTGMAKLAGTEVVVRGVRISPRDIVVADFFVRANNGVPAYDGVIEANGALRLTDGSGNKRVPLPSTLRGLTGARVWVAVRDGKPTGYGLIAQR